MTRAKKYPVIADFTDVETGKEIKAGTQFEAAAARVPKLVAAGVIEDPGAATDEEEE